LKRIVYFFIIILTVFVTKPLWEGPVREQIPESVSDTFYSIKEFTTQIIDGDFSHDQLGEQYLSLHPTIPDEEQEPVKKIALSIPDEQAFSVGNVEIGDAKVDVEQRYGAAMRESENEYGLAWSTYHENYQNFIMVAYDDGEIVRGLFTNQDLLTSQFGLGIGDTRALVHEVLGESEEFIHYDNFSYQINSEDEYDIYRIDGNYVTIFYDLHEGDRVTAIQLIDAEIEMIKNDLYPPGSQALKEGFEYQLFDLTNATRVYNGLSILEWEENVRETARKHSADMAENQFFSHTNLANQSFSDRMIEDGIRFRLAGENLAYGQFNSIFAHQGLMNSAGHRENILHDGFTKLGVGVAFNRDQHPFYTENFFTD